MTYIATLISCCAQQAGFKLTVQHSSDFLHVNTLLGSSVPIDLFTGQSLMSSGSSVVVVVVDIFGEDYALLLTYALCNGYQQQNTASMLLLHIVELPRNFFMSMGTVVLWPFFMFHWLVLKLLGEMNRVISVPLHWFYLMNILFFACVCVSNCPFMKGRKKVLPSLTFNSDYMTHCGKIQLASVEIQFLQE